MSIITLLLFINLNLKILIENNSLTILFVVENLGIVKINFHLQNCILIFYKLQNLSKNNIVFLYHFTLFVKIFGKFLIFEFSILRFIHKSLIMKVHKNY